MGEERNGKGNEENNWRIKYIFSIGEGKYSFFSNEKEKEENIWRRKIFFEEPQMDDF